MFKTQALLVNFYAIHVKSVSTGNQGVSSRGTNLRKMDNSH